MTRPIDAHWLTLDRHFEHHLRIVDRFRQAGPESVRRMWSSQTIEEGKRLSHFERDALIERHCELFGTWPE